MNNTTNQKLKKAVHAYWNKASCGTNCTSEKKFSRSYFENIENFRYTCESEIFAFAQFTRFYDKKILEVGVGAGTDFLQWTRAGAHASGIDLTQEAIDNTSNRLNLYELTADNLQVADAEHLPYPDNSFDLVYSWGVIHHSPNMLACLEEIIRVTKPAGTIKLMVYNRHSLFVLERWLTAALLKGKPFQSLSKVLFYHQESRGTKAYTIKEIKKMLQNYPVSIQQLYASPTQHETNYFNTMIWSWLTHKLAHLFGWHETGFFMRIELEKKS